jgi:hypothetical protein
MTNYNLTAIIPRSALAKAKKAARKKVLEKVRARREEIYKRFQQEQKHRLQANGEVL